MNEREAKKEAMIVVLNGARQAFDLMASAAEMHPDFAAAPENYKAGFYDAMVLVRDVLIESGKKIEEL